MHEATHARRVGISSGVRRAKEGCRCWCHVRHCSTCKGRGEEGTGPRREEEAPALELHDHEGIRVDESRGALLASTVWAMWEVKTMHDTTRHTEGMPYVLKKAAKRTVILEGKLGVDGGREGLRSTCELVTRHENKAKLGENEDAKRRRPRLLRPRVRRRRRRRGEGRRGGRAGPRRPRWRPRS